MLRSETVIDSFAVQVNTTVKTLRDNLVDELVEWVRLRRVGKVVKTEKGTKYISTIYKIYSNHKVIASLHLGTTNIKDEDGNLIKTIHYLKISFAGLSSRKLNIDKATNKAVDEIIGYLNTNEIDYKISELDVAIDMFCRFENVLAVVKTKRPNVKYNPVGAVCNICGDTISYLENYQPRRVYKASKRSYLYDKRVKERLHFDITRFEVKFQKPFFRSHGLDLRAIERAFNGYSLFYFSNKKEKKRVADVLNSVDIKYYRYAIKELEEKCATIKPEIEDIARFVYKIENTFIDKQGNIRSLPISKNFSICNCSEDNYKEKANARANHNRL